MSALQFAARMACRRSSRDGAGLSVVVICRSSFFFMLDPAPAFEWLEAGADVKAMIEEASARFGLTPRVDEIEGWSRADIARIARERGSRVVVLPMLGAGAGPLVRWQRRDLVAALVGRCQAVVVDEYDRPFDGSP
jgi:hypothetical protein